MSSLAELTGRNEISSSSKVGSEAGAGNTRPDASSCVRTAVEIASAAEAMGLAHQQWGPEHGV